MHVSRRRLITQGLCACTGCFAGSLAFARVSPSSLTPLVGANYKPVDDDERGLWQACEKLEDAIAHSNLLVGDKALTGYVEQVLGRLLGEKSADIRTYIVRNPDFNASMAPNGMMLVHTGLLARMRNEAQLAAVLGHESGHYLRRHSLRSWRDTRAKTAVMSFIALAGGAASGVTGQNWYDIANAINGTLLMSLFQFSRDMESEADAYGLRLMHDTRYSPQAASEVWSQLIEERQASAAARKKKYKDAARSALSTHPPSDDRMGDLAESARELDRSRSSGGEYEERSEEWRVTTGRLRPMLLEEQIRLNDSGASLYVLNSLAKDGWDGTLRYFEGEAYRLRDEEGDGARAAEAYAASVRFTDTLPEAFRAHGYAQLKAGNKEDGRRALLRYLDLRPDAADAAMVKFSVQQ
jgi:beta-barrel assembly-enhancing protease